MAGSAPLRILESHVGKWYDVDGAVGDHQRVTSPSTHVHDDHRPVDTRSQQIVNIRRIEERLEAVERPDLVDQLIPLPSEHPAAIGVRLVDGHRMRLSDPEVEGIWLLMITHHLAPPIHSMALSTPAAM
ncbi:hypothetical protein [Gordonia sp. NB41Y]|uniref:hypothetical protein n=1 Tax=Gordonia sp. NB41Y TaxID=875808 RepID=UPI0002BE3DCD|nr:hypothetical protein [Gordonia sp. NB41Y]WLP92132.1 hypothetical protein Q9K23_07850 [Gordonia sp. NB41Y]